MHNEWQEGAETKVQELPDWQWVKGQKQRDSYTGSEGWLLWKSKKEGQNECTGKRWTEEKVLLQRRWFQMFFVGDRTITILWQSSNLDEKEI